MNNFKAGDNVTVKQCKSDGIVQCLIVSSESHKPYMAEVKVGGVVMRYYLNELEGIK